MEFSDHIVFVDESGDHGLENIDAVYPVFVLTFCVFKISDYVNIAVPRTQSLKFQYFGHDQIILHEKDIRKQDGVFLQFRGDAVRRHNFLGDISNLVNEVPFKIISIIIDKTKLIDMYISPYNPYNLGLRFGLERVAQHLINAGCSSKLTHIVFEKRGKKEDDELELEFRRICDNHVLGYKKFDFSKLLLRPLFADKRSNSTGLQIADLTARPIGVNFLNPDKQNRAFEIIEPKIKAKKIFP